MDNLKEEVERGFFRCIDYSGAGAFIRAVSEDAINECVAISNDKGKLRVRIKSAGPGKGGWYQKILDDGNNRIVGDPAFVPAGKPSPVKVDGREIGVARGY